MKNWNILKALGFLMAAILIVFGGMANLVRTMSLGMGKIFRNR
jgi:hypothetical protein